MEKIKTRTLKTAGMRHPAHLNTLRLEMVTKKIRTVFYLDKAERKTFDRLSKKTGAPLAELLRRAVAMYLKARKKKK